MNRCRKDYNPDELDYECEKETENKPFDELDERERIKQLEEEANKDIFCFDFSTQNYKEKAYEGSFDLTKAWEFLSSEETADRLEAITYATYFARRNNNDAKNFIIMIINNPDLVDNEKFLVDKAKKAFTFFITSFIRTEIEKLYKQHGVIFPTVAKQQEAIRTAMQCCWIPIMSGLSSYDPEKGKITTFLRTRIIEGYSLYESQRSKKPSKQLLFIDGKIAMARKKIEDRGLEPTPRLISLELKEMGIDIGYQQIIASNYRIVGESGTFSYDDSSSEALNFQKNEVQKDFLTPEEHLSKIQKSEKITNAMSSLSDEQQQILLLSLGFEIDDGCIYEANKYTDSEISKMLNIPIKDIFKKRQKALEVLKGNLTNNKNNNKNDEEFVFLDSLDDENMEDFLSSIVKITDNNFKESDA